MSAYPTNEQRRLPVTTAGCAPVPPAGRARLRALFYIAWTLLVVACVTWLVFGLRRLHSGDLLILADTDGSSAPFGMNLRRGLLLAHLSLYRAYPWVFFAPYALFLAGRFSLERGRLGRHLPLQLLACALFVLGCQTLNRWIASAQPARVILTVTETTRETDGPTADAGRHIETISQILQVTTNDTLEEHFPPDHEVMEKLVRGVSNGMVRLRSSAPETSVSQSNVDAEPDWPTLTSAPDAMRPFPQLPQSDSDPSPSRHMGFVLQRGRAGGFPVPGLGMGKLFGVLLDLLAFASLLGLGHAVHFYRRFQERGRRATLLESSLAKARLHALQAQLHPHFLFNSLNSIASLLRSDPRAAEEMLTSLGDLLRLVLSQASRQETSLREELRFLDLYMDIQRTRFGDRLDFRKEVAPELMELQVPSLLLQPIVENAIRHGLESTGGAGCVRLSGEVRGGLLELEVADNGVGNPGLVQGLIPWGVGLSNVRERLQSLFGSAASLAFDSAPVRGLVVRIQIPARREALPSMTTTSGS